MQLFTNNVIIKHNNACGLAIRPTLHEAYLAALAGDPVAGLGSACREDLEAGGLVDANRCRHDRASPVSSDPCGHASIGHASSTDRIAGKGPIRQVAGSAERARALRGGRHRPDRAGGQITRAKVD